MQQAWLDANATENEPQFVALVGIDWADREHVWCWQAAGENKRETGGFAAKAGAVEAWVGDLVRRFGSGPIAVAIEQTRAALLWQLQQSMNSCIFMWYRHRPARHFARRFILPEPRTIRGTPIWCWTC